MLRPTEYTTRHGGTMTGELVIWEEARGFGFVRLSGERTNAFLHVRDLEGAQDTPPRIGDLIAFELRETERGLRAFGARIVKDAAEPPARR